MFEIFKKLNLVKSTCKCGLSFWSISDTLCGDCDKQKDELKYNLEYKPFKISQIEFHDKTIAYFSNLGYRFDETDNLRSTLTNITYINAGIVKYKPIFTENLTRPNSILKRCSLHYCLRFNDLDLVGDKTHLTSFIMLGQHKFNIHTKEEFETYFIDLFNFIEQYIPLKFLKFHESEWTDYNTQGKSIEFYSNGVELLNQVYTTHQYDNFKYVTEIENKFLDMGCGFQRLYCYITKSDLTNFYECIDLQTFDYIKTILIANLSGIYCSKTGVGYNLRILLRKLIDKNINYKQFEKQYISIYHQLKKYKSFSLHSDIQILLEQIKQEYELYRKSI